MKERDRNYMYTKFHGHRSTCAYFMAYYIDPNNDQKIAKSEKNSKNRESELTMVPLSDKLLYQWFKTDLLSEAADFNKKRFLMDWTKVFYEALIFY